MLAMRPTWPQAAAPQRPANRIIKEVKMGIYVFHQGAYENGQLWYSYFDGTTWQQDKQVQNVGMSFSPSAVVWRNMIHVFHQGLEQNGELWYSYHDGQNWQPDQPVPGVSIGNPADYASEGTFGVAPMSPAAVVYNNNC